MPNNRNIASASQRPFDPARRPRETCQRHSEAGGSSHTPTTTGTGCKDPVVGQSGNLQDVRVGGILLPPWDCLHDVIADVSKNPWDQGRSRTSSMLLRLPTFEEHAIIDDSSIAGSLHVERSDRRPRFRIDAMVNEGLISHTDGGFPPLG